MQDKKNTPSSGLIKMVYDQILNMTLKNELPSIRYYIGTEYPSQSKKNGWPELSFEERFKLEAEAISEKYLGSLDFTNIVNMGEDIIISPDIIDLSKIINSRERDIFIKLVVKRAEAWLAILNYIMNFSKFEEQKEVKLEMHELPKELEQVVVAYLHVAYAAIAEHGNYNLGIIDDIIGRSLCNYYKFNEKEFLVAKDELNSAFV